VSYHYYVLILASPAVLSRYVYVVLVGYCSYHCLRRLYWSYHRLHRLYWFGSFFSCSFSDLRANLFPFFGHELYIFFILRRTIRAVTPPTYHVHLTLITSRSQFQQISLLPLLLLPSFVDGATLSFVSPRFGCLLRGLISFRRVT
jgi:hypothetical protein